MAELLSALAIGGGEDGRIGGGGCRLTVSVCEAGNAATEAGLETPARPR